MVSITEMSPTVLRHHGYRFSFFSKEEPRMHVHITKAEKEAKFWLEPEIELAKNYNYSRKQLKEIEKLIEENYDDLIKRWKAHHSS